MPTAATHSGPFHADDVLAWSLLTLYWAPDATLVRSREAADWARADVVFDVGAVFDPALGRFDHHQPAYTGPRSSAGMVLDWLLDTGRVDLPLAEHLRAHLVNYVDDVDNGRVTPKDGVPCFAKLVDAYSRGPVTAEDFDRAFFAAANAARGMVVGLAAGHAKARASEAAVVAEMARAVAEGRRWLDLPEGLSWKEPYFAHGGATHPTDFVVVPHLDGSWRILAIPPALGDFGQKVPLPAAWAGKAGPELDAATGGTGGMFCHKNRFIAVFATREALLSACAAILRGA